MIGARGNLLDRGTPGIIDAIVLVTAAIVTEGAGTGPAQDEASACPALGDGPAKAAQAVMLRIPATRPSPNEVALSCIADALPCGTCLR
jgi:hypothetical protein